MNNTFTYPKSFSKLYSSTVTKPFVMKPMFNTSIQSRLFTPKQPTYFNASNQMKRIKPISQPNLSVFGLSATLRKEMSTIKPFGNLHKELTSSLSSRLNEINSSYSKQLSSITNISTNWMTQANKVFSPVNHALKYYEENKEEIDKTLELFESYAKEYPVEAEEMSIIEFIDFVEFHENFEKVFNDILIPVANYQIPNSYQLLLDKNDVFNSLLEKYLTSEEKELINKVFLLSISHFTENYINDITQYSETTLLTKILFLIIFFPYIKKFLRH